MAEPTPSNQPNATTPKAPTVGASAPPNRAGTSAERGHSGSGSNGANGNGNGKGGGTVKAPPAASPAPTPGDRGGISGMPPIDQLKDRPLGRVLTKMGKVTRE